MISNTRYQNKTPSCWSNKSID